MAVDVGTARERSVAAAERNAAVRGGPGGPGEMLGLRRAAEQLLLKPGELELGTCLGVIRAVADPAGRRRVPRTEVDRLRTAGGFPESLRERVRAVGTAEGAALLGVGPSRFARLARVGCFSPAAFRVNRYRAVVWRYPAAELRRFADREPQLLTGSTPKGLRAMLDAGEDWRARNWRSRRIGQLVRETDDAWRRAAVSAAVLSADQLLDIVDDPYERAHLRRLQPALLPLRAGSSASWPVVEGLLFADDPDEILWHRISLLLCLDEARAVRPAPRPGMQDPAPMQTVSEPGLMGTVSVPETQGPSLGPMESGPGAPDPRPWRTAYGPGRPGGSAPGPERASSVPEKAGRPAPEPTAGAGAATSELWEPAPERPPGGDVARRAGVTGPAGVTDPAGVTAVTDPARGAAPAETAAPAPLPGELSGGPTPGRAAEHRTGGAWRRLFRKPR